MDTEERLAVFLDYENLALGAREHLGGMAFDFGPIADALAIRGRVVVRRAYADWSYFDDDRRSLTRHQVELIEMPQRMGASRKNAADIKMVVDAIEMAFERDYISTFVMCTGDSDFSPLVHKLRELNRRVIGVGVEQSTSRLLPPACDEFLFYDRLEGVEVPEDGETDAPVRGRSTQRSTRPASRTRNAQPSARDAVPAGDIATSSPAEDIATSSPADSPVAEQPDGDEATDRVGSGGQDETRARPAALDVLVAQTLAGLESSAGGPVTASVLKRTLLRRDPTFSEADHGFRTFGAVITDLAGRGLVVTAPGPATGDPVVGLPEHGERESAFALLRDVVAEAGGEVALSGLKDLLRKRRPEFSEKSSGHRNFLRFCRAAEEAGVVDLRWDEPSGDYLVSTR